MSHCIDCGTEIVETGIESDVLRCPGCEYRMNLKKAMRKTTLYCIIAIVILGLGANLLFTILRFLFLTF